MKSVGALQLVRWRCGHRGPVTLHTQDWPNYSVGGHLVCSSDGILDQVCNIDDDQLSSHGGMLLICLLRRV